MVGMANIPIPSAETSSQSHEPFLKPLKGHPLPVPCGALVAEDKDENGQPLPAATWSPPVAFNSATPVALLPACWDPLVSSGRESEAFQGHLDGGLHVKNLPASPSLGCVAPRAAASLVARDGRPWRGRPFHRSTTACQ